MSSSADYRKYSRAAGHCHRHCDLVHTGGGLLLAMMCA